MAGPSALVQEPSDTPSHGKGKKKATKGRKPAKEFAIKLGSTAAK